MGFIVLEIQNLVRILDIGIMLDSKRMLWIGVVRKAPSADLMAEWSMLLIGLIVDVVQLP